MWDGEVKRLNTINPLAVVDSVEALRYPLYTSLLLTYIHPHTYIHICVIVVAFCRTLRSRSPAKTATVSGQKSREYSRTTR